MYYERAEVLRLRVVQATDRVGPRKTSSSTNWQASSINEKENACQIAINVLPPSATEVHDRLAEDHRHARRSKRNKASLRDIEAQSHQPGWRSVAFLRSSEEDDYYRIDSKKSGGC